MSELTGQVRDVLQAQMTATPQFFHDGWIGGSALGVLEFGVTISDRDQWWVARRARLLLDELRKHTDLPLVLVSETKNKPLPHRNRGKYRLRRRKKATNA
jgi:hypothetical protein